MFQSTAPRAHFACAHGRHVVVHQYLASVFILSRGASTLGLAPYNMVAHLHIYGCTSIPYIPNNTWFFSHRFCFSWIFSIHCQQVNLCHYLIGLAVLFHRRLNESLKKDEYVQNLSLVRGIACVSGANQPVNGKGGINFSIPWHICVRGSVLFAEGEKHTQSMWSHKHATKMVSSPVSLWRRRMRKPHSHCVR